MDRTEKDPPALKPVFAGRRAPEPHGKAISDAEGSKHTGPGVGHQCRIVMLESVAANEDKQKHGAGYTQTPDCGMCHVTSVCHSSNHELLLTCSIHCIH